MALVRLPHAEFLKKGYRVIRTPFFLVKTTPNNLKTHRIGIVVSKSAIKKAVDRNFWKRQARIQLVRLSGKPSDILLILNSKILSLTKSQFSQELKKIIL
jgi:ribonuclease P protein component